MEQTTMIRVLQVVNNMDRAGLETMLMNYYRNVNKEKIQFDFLTHREMVGAYENEIRSLGGKIYKAPRLYPWNYIKYYHYLRNLFDNHSEYRIVHSHIDAMSFFPLYIAKRKKIPIRIAHSHSSKIDIDVKLPIKFIAKKGISKVANELFACSNVAGKFMFQNEKYKIIHNATDLNKFTYNSSKREKVRKKLGLEDKYVIGHVGRYCYIKNQKFLIDVYREILKEKENSVLLLIGKGEDEYKIRRKIDKYNLGEKVILLIDRKDTDELYQCMDVFVLPSLFEGLPVVSVEAQANGLPCYMSKSISEEAILTENAKQISLNSGAKKWAEIILSSNNKRNKNAIKQLTKKGYDIKQEAQKIQRWYIDAQRKYENSNYWS